jgi:hypothetical protein
MNDGDGRVTGEGRNGGGMPGGGFVPWDVLPVEDGALDVTIRPLVATLNRTGWARTVFSCAGHPEEPDAIARGRRQAHLDLLVADVRRWQTVVRRLRRRVPPAVDALGGPAGLRLVEGSLGPPPSWLRVALRQEPVSPPPPGGATSSAPAGRARPAVPWWQLLLPDALTAAAGSDGRRWRYRRLVLEPVPYDLAPDVCRRALDAALEATLATLDDVGEAAPATTW